MLLSFWSEYLTFFIVLFGTIALIVIGYLVYVKTRQGGYDPDDAFESLAKPIPKNQTTEENPEAKTFDGEVVEVITHVAGNRKEDDVEDEISSNLDHDGQPVKTDAKKETDTQEKPPAPKRPATDSFDRLEQALKKYQSLHKDEKGESSNDEEEVKSALEEALENDEPDGDKKAKRYHVLYRKEDNKWYVKREGTERIAKVLETQKEAIAFATIKAINQGTTVVVHKRDGKIRKYSL